MWLSVRRAGGAHELLPLFAGLQAVDGNDCDELHSGTPDRACEEDAGGDGNANLRDCPAFGLLQPEPLHDGVPQAGRSDTQSFPGSAVITI